MSKKRFSGCRPFVRHRSGFSLIEILIVISMLLIFASIGSDSLDRLDGGSRARMSAQTIAGILNGARTAAVRTRKNVCVSLTRAPVTDIKSCGLIVEVTEAVSDTVLNDESNVGPTCLYGADTTSVSSGDYRRVSHFLPSTTYIIPTEGVL